MSDTFYRDPNAGDHEDGSRYFNEDGSVSACARCGTGDLSADLAKNDGICYWCIKAEDGAMNDGIRNDLR